MDLMTGIAAASQALGMVKQVKEIGASLDSAEFKLKIAEITEKLADIKIALADAKTEIDAKSNEIANLE